jgi:PhzF family phenazine biosynthesis protein
MQQIAAVLNLSETAFVRPGGDGFALRWFTPVKEVDLCGHATLAAAHVLWEKGIIDSGSEIRFETLSGQLTCYRRDALIKMDFPAEPAQALEESDRLASALGIRPEYVGRNRLDYLARLGSEKEVRWLAPDLDLLSDLDGRGVIVTATADAGREYDFVSRYFAPSFGVPEDPVTGSAHCCLGPYWQERLGKNPLTGFQASRRGGIVHVDVRENRVVLGGSAVIASTSELGVPPAGY